MRYRTYFVDDVANFHNLLCNTRLFTNIDLYIFMVFHRSYSQDGKQRIFRDSPEVLNCFLPSHAVYVDVNYVNNLPEEMKRLSFIGNIAKDLGLMASRLSGHKARIDTEANQKSY